MQSLKELIRSTFQHRTRIPEESLLKYDEGFCDLDPWYGEFLRESEGKLDMPQIDSLLACFLLPGVLPKILAADLLGALADPEYQHAGSFLSELCAVYSESLRPDSLEFLGSHESLQTVFEEMSDIESAVILLGICRVARSHPEFVSGAPIQSFAAWLSLRAATAEKRAGLLKRVESRMLGRLGLL